MGQAIGCSLARPCAFSQPVSRLAFDASLLKPPLARSEQALKQFLRNAPANILVRYRYDAGPAGVRKRLRAIAACVVACIR